MKLQNVQAYPIKDVPDHLTKECANLGKDLLKKVKNILADKNPNIILGAINFLHSAILKELVSDKPEEQKKATKMAVIALIKNNYFLNGWDFESGLE